MVSGCKIKFVPGSCHQDRNKISHTVTISVICVDNKQFLKFPLIAATSVENGNGRIIIYRLGTCQKYAGNSESLCGQMRFVATICCSVSFPGMEIGTPEINQF